MKPSEPIEAAHTASHRRSQVSESSSEAGEKALALSRSSFSTWPTEGGSASTAAAAARRSDARAAREDDGLHRADRSRRAREERKRQLEPSFSAMLFLAASHALPQFPRSSLQPLDAEPSALGLSSLLAPLWERTSLADQRRAGLLGGRNHDTTWAAGDAVTSVAAVAAGAAVPSKSDRPHEPPPAADAAPEGGRLLSLKVPRHARSQRA